MRGQSLLSITGAVVLLTASTTAYTTYDEDVRLLHSARPQIKLWQTIQQHRQHSFTPDLYAGDHEDQKVLTFGKGQPEWQDHRHLHYQSYCFDQPLDHYDPKNNVTFCQRYWVSLKHWNKEQKDSPVYVLDGGETSGANRLPFLDTGILEILTNATGGIGIVLEHRYYGKSLPNTSYPSGEPFSLSTDDLRFLTSEQALMDSARLIQGLDLSHLDKHLDREQMSNEVRPWIWYGGSYAGAMTAFLLKGWGYDNGTMLDRMPPPHPAIIALDPTRLPRRYENVTLGEHSRISINISSGSTPRPHKGLVWGGIASSAVTHAQTSFPDYFQAIQTWAPDECMRTLEDAVETIDQLLELQGGKWRRTVQGWFGLEDLEHVQDFADVLASVLGGWQGRNWDPKVGSDEFYRFCDVLTGQPSKKIASLGGLELPLRMGPLKVPVSIYQYAKYVREMVEESCPLEKDGKPDVEQCFGSFDPEPYKETGIDQKWRLWLFQVCENWGYFMPAPLEGKRIISKFLDLEFTSKVCHVAYPPGEHLRLPHPGKPDVERVNARGDFAIEASRLAFIDGDSDPWRPATPQSDYAIKRKSTLDKPVILIDDAVHHFDENGLANPSKEPKRIRQVHHKEIEFVKSWVREWKEHQDKL